MTTQQRKLWHEGRELWQEYINANDYSFTYTERGLTKLSKLLDLNKSYIKERLNIYLNS